jgi:hypothetical protein
MFNQKSPRRWTLTFPVFGDYAMKNAIANKTEVLLLSRVAEVSQTVIAEAIGRDAGTVSRFFSGKTGLHIDEMEDFFAAMGLKLIDCKDQDTVTLAKDHYEALRILAKKGV